MLREVSGLPDVAGGGDQMNVVIVDDQGSARTMLRHIIEDIGSELMVHDFGDPSRALGWCQATPPDLVLLDYRMPGMNGLEFASRFRRLPLHRDVPIVLITVVGDEPIRQAALDAGIIDFLVKPVRPRELRARCRNLLQFRRHAQNVKDRALSLEQQLLSSMHEVEERERETMSRLARAIEYRDVGTSAFLERMSRFAGVIADELGLSEEEARVIELAAPLHDLGKIAIPDSVLLKAGPLDESELAIMRRHPRIGHQLLSGSENRFMQVGAIVALADVLDALLSARPYKNAWTLDASLEYIQAHRGRLFDPQCVDALMRGRSQVEDICDRYSVVSPRPGTE